MLYRSLVEQLVSSNLESQIAARMAILAQQENAIEPLVSVYSGGVNDVQGLAVLDILAEIGGFEAMALLRNVFAFEDKRPVMRYAAAKGLLRNEHNLSPDEVVEVTRFLAEV
jgi:hypothetical protein